MILFLFFIQSTTANQHLYFSKKRLSSNFIEPQEIFQLSILTLFFEYKESNVVNVYDMYYREAIMDDQYFKIMDQTKKLIIIILNIKKQDLVDENIICKVNNIIRFFNSINYNNTEKMNDVKLLCDLFKDKYCIKKVIDPLCTEIFYIFARFIKSQGQKTDKFFKESINALNLFKSRKYANLNIKNCDFENVANIFKHFKEQNFESNTTLLIFHFNMFEFYFVYFATLIKKIALRNYDTGMKKEESNKNILEMYNQKYKEEDEINAMVIYSYFCKKEIEQLRKWNEQNKSEDANFLLNFLSSQVISNTIRFWISVFFDDDINYTEKFINFFIDEYANFYCNVMNFLEKIIIQEIPFKNDDKIWIYKTVC